MNKRQVDYLVSASEAIRDAQVKEISEETLKRARGWKLAVHDGEGTQSGAGPNSLRLHSIRVCCPKTWRPDWEYEYSPVEMGDTIALPVPVEGERALPSNIAFLRQQIEIAVRDANEALDTLSRLLKKADSLREPMRKEATAEVDRSNRDHELRVRQIERASLATGSGKEAFQEMLDWLTQCNGGLSIVESIRPLLPVRRRR